MNLTCRDTQTVEHRPDAGATTGLRRVLVGLDLSISYQQNVAFDVTPNAFEHVVLCFVFAPATCAIRWRSTGGKLVSEQLRSGRIYILSPGSVRAIEWEGAAESMLLYVERELLERFPIAPANIMAPVVLSGGVADDGLWRMAEQLRTICRSDAPDPEVAEDVGVALVHRLSTLLRSGSAQALESAPSGFGGLSAGGVQLVREYVFENLHRDITTAELARITGLAPERFVEVFKLSTGFTPARYITFCRVERARELLAEGWPLIRDVAVLVGIPEPANFSERFKSVYGCRPKVVRAQAWGAVESGTLRRRERARPTLRAV